MIDQGLKISTQVWIRNVKEEKAEGARAIGTPIRICVGFFLLLCYENKWNVFKVCWYLKTYYEHTYYKKSVNPYTESSKSKEINPV